MSGQSVEVVIAIALAAMCGTVLLLGLVATALVMRRISLGLAALHEVLSGVGEATGPLTGRITGIATNVGTLRAAVTALSQLVHSRTGTADVRY